GRRPFRGRDGAARGRPTTGAGAVAEGIPRLPGLGILSAVHDPFLIRDITSVRLVQALERSGILPEDIGRAIASGEFSLAFVHSLFPVSSTVPLSDLTFDELCRRFGFDMQFLQDVYAGLGLPQ